MKFTKLISTLILAGTVGVVALVTTSTTDVQAAVKTHKVTKLPKNFRGTWYSNSSWEKKIKVTARKFGSSTYRKKHDENSIASSERYFMPFKISGKGAPKNAMYLVTSIGVNTIRRTSIGGEPVLIRYDEQEHGNGLTIYTKTKHSSHQKAISGTNPFGINISTRKDALENQKFYKKANPIVKKQFGKAMKKKVDQIKSKPFKGIKIVSYSAYGFYDKVV